MKREVFTWGLYDLSNTIFSALFVTFFFPFYVKLLGGTEFQIGLVFGLSMFFVGLVVPIIGAWSDSLGRRLPFIIFFTIVCCFLTGLISWLPLWAVLVAGFFANFCYHGALTTYNALLPVVAGKNFGRVSGVGIAMGYIGTVLALIIAFVLLSYFGWETLDGARAIFIAVAVLFFVLSLPTFIFIKEKVRIGHRHFLAGLTSVIDTLSNLKKHRSFVLFFLSMFFYANAINAVIVFLFLFARQQIGLTMKMFLIVYVIQSIGAVVGSFFAGRLVDRFSAKRVLLWSGFLWIGVIILLLFVKSLPMFIFAGILGGVALGSVWTAQRPKLLELVSKHRVGEFFGFLELANKFSGVFGPIIFGFLASFVSYSSALLSLILFFLVGLLFLRKVQ